MLKKAQNPNQCYSRRAIYMPGNSGLKKRKHEIETDFNPITNGTILQNNHLQTLSVKSITEPQISITKKIVRKQRIFGNKLDFEIKTFDKNNKQSTKVTSQYTQSDKQSILKSSYRPVTAQQIQQLKFHNKFVKNMQSKIKNSFVPNETLSSFVNLQRQIQSLRDSENLKNEVIQPCLTPNHDQLQPSELDEANTLQHSQPIFDLEKPTEIPSQNELYIQQLFDKYPDYNNHLAGLCKCYTCTCLQNCQCSYKKMLIQYHPKYQSNYSNNYNNQLDQSKEHQNEHHKTLVDKCLKNDFIIFEVKAQSQRYSTAGHDYKNFGLQEKTQCCKPQEILKTFSLQDLTNYKLNFFQAPVYPNLQYKQNKQKLIFPSEPVIKSSEYKEKFQQKLNQNEYQITCNNRQKRSPYSEMVSFGHLTQNKQCFLGKQTYDKTDLMINQNNLTTQNGMNNFFRSTNQDYGKIKAVRCN